MKCLKRPEGSADAWAAKKRKGRGVGGRKKNKKHKRPDKIKTFAVRKHRTKVPVSDTPFVMEYGLSWEQVFRISKNRFDCYRNPRIEISMNKSADLRDEFSSYCGQKKTIKNWLFYV